MVVGVLPHLDKEKAVSRKEQPIQQRCGGMSAPAVVGRSRERPVRSARSTSQFGTRRREWGDLVGRNVTAVDADLPGRRDALEEPTEPLLTRDGRKRMECRTTLDVRRGVLKAVLHFCMVARGTWNALASTFRLAWRCVRFTRVKSESHD